MRILHLFLATILTAGTAMADWPQFMGTDRNETTTDSALARSWPEHGPKELWQFPLGKGWGGAAISDGNVYVLDRSPDQQEVLRCIDLKSGKEQWNFAYDAAGEKIDHNGTRSTPAIDDKYVFTVGCYGAMNCVDKATHKVVWTHNLIADFAGQLPHWGVTQSPLLYKDWVIVAPQAPKVGVVAYEKTSGKIVWQSDFIGSGDTSYVSPAIFKVAGSDQVIMLSQVPGKKRANAVGIDPATGKILWKFDKWECGIPIPAPVECGDGRFFLTGGYDAGSAMFKVEKKDDQYNITQIWNDKTRLGAMTGDQKAKEKKLTISSHIHGGIFYKDHLYVNGNSIQNGGNIGLACMDLSGKILWKTAKAPAFDLGDVILVDDVLVALDGGSGTLRMALANPEGYKQLAEAKVLDQNKTVWAPMAYSDGNLIVRDDNLMKCLDMHGGK